MSKKLNLKKIDPSSTGKFKSEDELKELTQKDLEKLYDLLYLMFAENKHSLLIILHGIDTAGKDGTVRHIYSGANPQGIRSFSFKKPTEEELKHDFLWRCHKHTPEAGYTAIFNRSYYEEVSAVKVHPELLKAQHLPEAMLKDPKLFEKRYHHINHFEKMLNDSGTKVIKFLLHISKDEQKERFEERLKDRKKNWKFSEQDLEERKYWDDYMKVFQEMINKTNTKHSPWHIIPADKKWYRNHLISKILVSTLSDLDMKFPPLSVNKKVKLK